MSYLKSQGVNRVYVDVWNQGRTYFNSPAMLKLVGQGGIATDQLSWEVKYAKQNGLQVYAWFEYGLMAAYLEVNNDFARKAQSLGWISGNAYNFVWLKPIPDVINFLADIMLDSIRNYKIDGVQLDDHFAWPTSLAGNNPNSMTTAMQTIFNRIRAVSSLPISLSPNTITEALSKYNVDWVKWGNMGIYSEVAPQLYRSDYASFQKELDYTLKNTPSSLHTYMLAGLRCNGSGPNTPWSELDKMLNETKSKNPRPIANKYSDGKLKRTLKRELRVRETVWW